MTVDVQVDEHRRVARVTIEGPVALDGFIDGIEALVGHPAFVRGMDVLVDMLGHVHQNTSADMRALARALLGKSEHLKGTRMGVAVSQTVSYGMARMLQTFLEDAPLSVAVFYDVHQAEEWLGIS